MKYLAIPLLLIVAACRQSSPPDNAARPEASEMRTIEDTQTPPSAVQPPPVLTDEAPALNPMTATNPENKVVLTQADETLRAGLPFAPAIGLDPVDGSKISIRSTTPTFTYKGRIFYFDSEANKKIFASNPEQFAKGRFAHL